MRVLLVHNHYQQPGGEDVVVAAEGALLEEHGHEVLRYTVHNRQVEGESPVGLAARAVWNPKHHAAVRRLVAEKGIDVVHVHNTLPLLSPAVCPGARSGGAAVVQTLHNYRLMCPAATFFRDGRVCEDCMGKLVAVPAVVHRCYRDSRQASAVVAATTALHRAAGTYRASIDAYIATTRFSRTKFVEGGLPERKIYVKPHFLTDGEMGSEERDGFALYVGRLSPEKGIGDLLEAWGVVGPRLPLKIVGDGPLRAEVVAAAESNASIEWLGPRSREDVLRLMGRARVVVVPSRCYETFGLVVIEAFAKGTPVIVSAGGALAELVEHGRTGRHFLGGDGSALVEQAGWFASHPDDAARMGREARREFEESYTAERNYERLMEVYDAAVQNRRAG